VHGGHRVKVQRVLCMKRARCSCFPPDGALADRSVASFQHSSSCGGRQRLTFPQPIARRLIFVHEGENDALQLRTHGRARTRGTVVSQFARLGRRAPPLAAAREAGEKRITAAEVLRGARCWWWGNRSSTRAVAGCGWWQDQALHVAEGHRPGAEAGRPPECHGVTDARQSPLMGVRA
jgi:hypothetical protein